MKGDQKIIDILNDLLTGELTAVDQYLIHGEMYADMGLDQLAGKSIHESDHERQHARALIQRILFLEGVPNLEKRSPASARKIASANCDRTALPTHTNNTRLRCCFMAKILYIWDPEYMKKQILCV